MRQMHVDVLTRGSHLASNEVSETGERQPPQLQPVDEVETNRLHLGCGTSASGGCSTRDLCPVRRCGVVRGVASSNADLSLTLSADVVHNIAEEVVRDSQDVDGQKQAINTMGTPQQVIVNLL
eukprot:GHVU01169893.1.p3 GENE.GHVU01169893.1~~GHVU01169893.1.p3  ORF type:complete len:123 (-),score=18.58 GHVU01169893.1:218-586(-)